jgi:hypothetical protein
MGDKQLKPASGCSIFFLGLLLIGFGVGTTALAAKLTTLDCERLAQQVNKGNCQLTSSSLLGKDTRTIELSSIQRAEMQRRNQDGKLLYRVVLITNDGDVPFVRSWSSGDSGKQAKVDNINGFLQNSGQASLLIKQDDRLLFYGIGGVLSLLGLLVWLSPFVNGITVETY